MYHPWSFVFFIEGGLTILWGILSFFITPDIIERVKFLTVAEKDLWLAKLKADQSKAKHEVNKSQVFEALLDYKTWLLSIIYLCYQTVINALVYTSVPIIKNFGFDRYNSILMGIPSGGIVFMVMMILSWSSDRVNDRSRHILIAGLFSYVAFVPLIFFHPKNTIEMWILYVLTFFTVLSMLFFFCHVIS